MKALHLPHVPTPKVVLSVTSLLRPHWKAMTMAMVGVGGIAVTELLEPWPLKIVIDHLLQDRPPPAWMGGALGWFGGDSLAVLNVAVLAVAAIAIGAAASTFLQSHLTTNVGQWVMHDLRKVLYHHIHRLSLAEHDEKRTGDLSKMTDTISKAAVSLERIREVLDTESGVRDVPGARAAGRFTGAIAFDRVSFAYTPAQPILTDVTFDIEPGQIAAFIGPTGGGKSTIISLVARFYDPVSGTVSIDGRDVRKYTMKSVREQVSFVLQETLLFHAPIWQNIAYGRPEATPADIITAAELANADEFIRQMPEGYDTLVGERGVTLSGGQRQRVSIARAIIRDTRILVMDEPTSGLDAQSEQAVFEALSRLMKDKTSIVIAHHLATIQQADMIVVVKDQTLVERGTHPQLLASGGFYAALHDVQFRKDQPDVAVA